MQKDREQMTRRKFIDQAAKAGGVAGRGDVFADRSGGGEEY